MPSSTARLRIGEKRPNVTRQQVFETEIPRVKNPRLQCAFSGSRTVRRFLFGRKGGETTRTQGKRKTYATRAPDNCRAPTMSNYDAILAEAESNRAAAGDLERRYARCPRSAPDDPRRACPCARDTDILTSRIAPNLAIPRESHIRGFVDRRVPRRTRPARRTLTSPTLHSPNAATMRTTAAGSPLSPTTTRSTPRSTAEPRFAPRAGRSFASAAPARSRACGTSSPGSPTSAFAGTSARTPWTARSGPSSAARRACRMDAGWTAPAWTSSSPR